MQHLQFVIHIHLFLLAQYKDLYRNFFPWDTYMKLKFHNSLLSYPRYMS